MLRQVAVVILLAAANAVPARAQTPEQELQQAVLGLYTDLNRGDAAAYLARHATTAIGEFPRNGLLRERQPQTLESFQADIAAGMMFNRTVHHIDAYVFGNTGVTTYYTTGPTTYPDGTVLDGTFRGSVFWVRESGQWKIFHSHISPLLTGNN